MGQALRKRYANLIGGGGYSPDKVYVESTDLDRVLMSAEANMAGLFSPVADQVWNENLKWQPIPVHTRPVEDDYRLALQKRCDRFLYLFSKSVVDFELEKLVQQNEQLLKYLSNKSGKDISSISDVFFLYDRLDVERVANMWYVVSIGCNFD